MNETPDYNEFYLLLLESSRKAFRYIKTQHIGESFYGFGLHHEPFWGYILPTYNTEEKLKEEAIKWQNDEHYGTSYSKVNLVNLQTSLRWSTREFFGEEFFEGVKQWLRYYKIVDRCIEFFDYEMNSNIILDITLGLDNQFENTFDIMNTICTKTLHTLIRENVFGDKEYRESVVINITMDDQDDSWLWQARTLNSPTVYERWTGEVKVMYEENQKIYDFLNEEDSHTPRL